jgi:adenylate cyclase
MEARPVRLQLYIAVVIALLATLEFSHLHLFASLDNRFNDFVVRHHSLTLEADSDIVIIDIDERSLKKMAEFEGKWPWPLAVHATLVELLQPYRPRAIIFDIQFSDRDRLRPESDAYLTEVAQKYSNVFFPMQIIATSSAYNWPFFGEELGFKPVADAVDDSSVSKGLILPLWDIARTGRVGTVNFSEDADGIGRRYLLRTRLHGWELPSLPAKVAAALGYPLPDADHIVLHWRGGIRPHQTVSFFDVYWSLNSQTPSINPQQLRNKILIIGGTAHGLHDLRATPVASLYPAVEILAIAIDNLKNRQFMQPLTNALPLAVTLGTLAIMMLLFVYHAHPVQIGFGLLVASAGLLATGYAAVMARLLLPVVTPLVFIWLYYAIAALLEYLREKSARHRAVSMFSRFLDPRVVHELVEGDPESSVSSRSQQITVLFSDIRGFTTLSENRSADEILDLLNRYFSRQVKVIFEHGGTMDKFIGDAIMAFWGAPVVQSDHAGRAVAAALDMVDTLQQFKHESGELGETFDIGIGIHSGEAVVGMIGFEERMDYTCIGDTVNLASRIEGQTKGLCRVLVSAETRALCQDEFDFVDHGFYKVKGREQEAHLYEPRRKSS